MKGLSEIHVVPSNEIYDHVASDNCLCEPRNVGNIWFHKPMDIVMEECNDAIPS